MSASAHPFSNPPHQGASSAGREHKVPASSLAAVVQQQLRVSPYIALRSLRCHAEGESLVLEGRVGSYYLKQLACAVAQRVGAGHPIDNRLEVVAGADMFWLDEEESAVDPLSGRRRRPAPGADAARSAAPATPQPA